MLKDSISTGTNNYVNTYAYTHTDKMTNDQDCEIKDSLLLKFLVMVLVLMVLIQIHCLQIASKNSIQ